ncbi:acyl-phosphate glycerol 3-phosphate acyltransferase [Methylobacterium sp. Leaf399]|uniref:lysophospholipid acyltransferase family protein n=1 Tax=unclassified Methylobacterium TaxID=2615210 RepID=UPI0006F60177|nr:MULTISPECIES: lysophospholipid acyltransferase family protein [unclassified Methylobacterium]KQP61770.1 acyl-phosphate glycerol 3-phosphate acyltransferase [Methylobacterium sp. Leaf108]KQT19907.1 acyl-phosphate glycerol 3-phosphate acyltransferase [Methylobacterium sp. Leaf399]KQT78430.1 acyl-phosphate glycerol 3-phosphate acyltransferase [Methylobacterium sp. Leaf466]
MLLLRSLAFNCAFYLATTVIAVAGLPTLVSRRAVIRLAQVWGRTTLWLLRVVGGLTVEFRGLENRPAGACIVAAKHQSALETLALVTVFPDFAYILKRELLWIPLIGWYLSRSGMVAIDRSRGAKAMATMNEAAAQAIRDGRQLIIFPEGTRRAPGAAPAYKLGITHLYAALDVPCVPVALDTGLYWPRRSLMRRPGTTVIAFLPPILPGLDRATFLDRLQERVEDASNALLAAAPYPAPVLAREEREPQRMA